jgi:hypothetical protein
MRSSVRNPHVFFLSLFMLFLAGPAFAGETASVRDSGRGELTYEFFDDPLAAGGLTPAGGTLTVVKRSMRTLLIRPRAQFVTEMLKSVENL